MKQFYRICVAIVVFVATGAVAMPTHAQTQGPANRSLHEQAQDIFQAHRDEAVQQVLDASRSEEAVLRANAIEAMQPLPDRARPLCSLAWTMRIKGCSSAPW